MKTIERLEKMETEERFQEIVKLWKKSDGKPYTFFQLLTLCETTADKDFAEIGFVYKYESRDVDDKRYIKYSDENGRLLYIYEIGGNEYDTMAIAKLLFTDELIDQIRTIADKKRKEMGWK